MSKKLRTLLILATLSNLFPTSAIATSLPAMFSFQGNGYGHGVGMSQIGARAKALAGESATAIIQYYYTGTNLETVTESQILRVNVGHLLTSAKLRSDSNGASLAIYAGDLSETQTARSLATLQSKTSLNFDLVNGEIAVSSTRGSRTNPIASGTTFTLRWSGTRYLDGPTTVLSLTSNKVINRYRHGQMTFKIIRDKTIGKRIEIINSVRLQDEYLWGVSEVPSSWPTAVLDAQAIASRTYAYAKSFKVRTACDCHLYGSLSDQTFAGYSKESEPKFGELWKAAVTRTAGLVITYAGEPITAYFTSSSGGVTETSEHAWGTATPYTVSVPDSASVDSVFNPRFASWTREISQSVIAQAFLLPDVVALQVLALNPAGSVASIQATSSTGLTAVLRGETFRSRSKLPSAWFSLK